MVGATSRGDRLCKSFGVYTALARFQPWIAEVMNQFSTVQEPVAEEPAVQEPLTHDQTLLSQLAQIFAGLGVGKKQKTLLPL